MKSLAQKQSIKPEPLPGDLAIWIFIFAELLVFGIFFITYAVARSREVELFNHFQQTLNTDIGAINTILLISASCFVVYSIRSLKRAEQRNPSRWMLLAIVCAGLFLVLKTHEFYGKLSAGISLSTNTFYMFYLSMTFFHYMHVILGLIILAVLYINLRADKYTATATVGLESGGAYWHMVDLVWIILFPLVYVIR